MDKVWRLVIACTAQDPMECGWRKVASIWNCSRCGPPCATTSSFASITSPFSFVLVKHSTCCSMSVNSPASEHIAPIVSRMAL